MPVLRSETEQLGALAQGQVGAFDALYYRYQQPVYANIFRLVRDVAAAEDLLQEVFIALWEHRLTLDPRRPVGGWLFVVSHNKAASYLKKRIREATALGAAPDEAAAALSAVVEAERFEQQWALVEAAVGQLPARQQRVFRLCRFEGKAPEEVAALVGISVASVKDYLKQATMAIRGRVRSTGRAAVASGILLFI